MLRPVAAACFVVFAVLGLCGGTAQAQTRTAWDELPALPDPVGFAGGFAGVSGDALLFAGGANFAPPVFENDKAWHDRVFVLPSPDGDWVDAGALPRALAYGMSVSYDGEVICLGGDDAERVYSDVFALKWDGETLEMRELPPLPEPVAYGGAALIGSTVYVVGGQTGKGIETATNRGYAMDLADASPAWERLPDMPAEAGVRAFNFVVAQHDGRSTKLYVFGGRHHHPGGVYDLAFLDDCWEFAPATQTWRRRADAPVALMAGSAAALGQSHVLVTSYADGSVLAAMSESGVPAAEYDHPGFPRTLYTYHTITNTWSQAGELPEGVMNAVTTTAVHWGGRIIVPSGEVRPRVRTPRVWSVAVEPHARSFSALNMGVLVVYLALMVGVGVFFVFRNKSTDDYFRGGQNIPWWAAACSIYATMLSSLTYVALPALVFATDWVLYPGMFIILLSAPVAIYIAMPFFRRIDATSAYEYLGKRFNLAVRLFGSGLFTLFHIGRMGIVMALTALALAAVTPLSPATAVLLMGGLCLVYCTLGGIEAVIWTDTIQAVVLLGGAVLCFAFILAGIDGGLGGFFDAGQANDKFTLFNLDFGPTSITTTALWVIILGGLGQNISSYTADQAVVQRYMTTKDTKAAAKSIWANGVMAVVGALLFFLIGTGLYAFYQSHPGKLDPTIQNDQVFPLFIATELPPGIAGLIVAGIFAAAQSTVSTSMNSTATTVVTDFMRPFNACKTERGYLNAARGLTFTMGVLGTLAGLIFVNPDIFARMDLYFKVIGMFMGALGGLFILGVMTRRTNGTGALVGILCGVGVMIAVWQATHINGYLYATIGIASCFVLGYLASFFTPRDAHGLSGLTLYDMPRREKSP
ncbi:MAG: sodium/solute symporter [Phycisphaerales bacterium JB063]